MADDFPQLHFRVVNNSTSDITRLAILASVKWSCLAWLYGGCKTPESIVTFYWIITERVEDFVIAGNGNAYISPMIISHYLSVIKFRDRSRVCRVAQRRRPFRMPSAPASVMLFSLSNNAWIGRHIISSPRDLTPSSRRLQALRSRKDRRWDFTRKNCKIRNPRGPSAFSLNDNDCKLTSEYSLEGPMSSGRFSGVTPMWSSLRPKRFLAKGMA